MDTSMDSVTKEEMLAKVPPAVRVEQPRLSRTGDLIAVRWDITTRLTVVLEHSLGLCRGSWAATFPCHGF